MTVTDYATNLADLIESHWTASNMDNNFTPDFDTNFYLESWSTRRRVCVHEISSGYEPSDASHSEETVTRLFQIDIFTLDVDELKDIREEVESIIRAHDLNPFTGVTSLLLKDLRDTSMTVGSLYRYTVTVEAVSYVTV